MDNENKDIENKIENYISMEVKGLSEDGTFTGYGAVFNNVDEGYDVIEDKAFNKTVKDKKSRALYLMHDTFGEILGGAKLSVDKIGLKVNGWLNMKSQYVIEKVYPLMVGDNPVITEMSIGYRSIKDEIKEQAGKYIRYIKELKLFEISLIPMGMAMNPKALITSVKSENDIFAYIKEHSDNESFRLKTLSLFGILPDDSDTQDEPELKSTDEPGEPEVEVTDNDPYEIFINALKKNKKT